MDGGGDRKGRDGGPFMSLSRGTCRELIGTGSTGGALETGERAQKGQCQSQAALPGPRLCFRGLPIAHSRQRHLFFSALLFCSATTCSISHGFSPVEVFDSPSLPGWVCQKKMPLVLSDPEFSESELSYLLIGCKRCDCWYGTGPLQISRFQGRSGMVVLTLHSLEPQSSNSHSQGSLRVKERPAVGLRPPARVLSCETLPELSYILVKSSFCNLPPNSKWFWSLII